MGRLMNGQTMTPLREEARIAIVTTAAPFQPDKGDQGPGAPYNGKSKFFQGLCQSD